MATTNGSTLKKPLLSLDTLTDRDQVAIDGTSYDLLKPEQLSLVSYNRIAPILTRFQALMEMKTLTDGESEELAQILDRVCRECLQAPPEVQARLTDEQRLQIVVAFAGLSQLLRRLLRALPETPLTTPATASPTTGAKRFRGSAASTRARRPKAG